MEMESMAPVKKVKELSDMKKLKIAVVAMKHELGLKMAGMGKQYNQNDCILHKALKRILDAE